MASSVIVDLQTGCKADTIIEAFHPVTTFLALYDTYYTRGKAFIDHIRTIALLAVTRA